MHKDLKLHKSELDEGDSGSSFKLWKFVKSLIAAEFFFALALPFLLENDLLTKKASQINIPLYNPFGLTGIVNTLSATTDKNQLELFELIVKIYCATLTTYFFARISHAVFWKHPLVNLKLMIFSSLMLLVSIIGISIGVSSGKGMYELSTFKPLAINLAEILILYFCVAFCFSELIAQSLLCGRLILANRWSR